MPAAARADTPTNPFNRTDRATPPRARSVLSALEPQSTTRPEGGAQERAVAYLRDLDELLRRRPELAETYLPAQISVEAMRWAV